ncbi:hypothetical protein Vi05172_g5915 [Venturia inaequalis]|nr:hypothetical protein Vi05172_g5915 [Venturia inaequalis]
MQFFNILALFAITAIAAPHNPAFEALQMLEGRDVQRCGAPHACCNDSNPCCAGSGGCQQLNPLPGCNSRCGGA